MGSEIKGGREVDLWVATLIVFEWVSGCKKKIKMVTHKSVCFFVNVFKVYLQKIINYQLMNIFFPQSLQWGSPPSDTHWRRTEHLHRIQGPEDPVHRPGQRQWLASRHFRSRGKYPMRPYLHGSRNRSKWELWHQHQVGSLVVLRM